MRLRGAGEFFGAKQHGIGEFRFGDPARDHDLLSLARQDAFHLVLEDANLGKPEHGLLRQAVDHEREAARLTPGNPTYRRSWADHCFHLSETLRQLGRHAEAAQTAAEGIELATKTGTTRTLGSYLIGNRADSLLRMGQLDEADELTSQALATLPDGVFSATLHQFRAEIAMMRGQYDLAVASNRATRRIVGDTADIQFTQTLRYTTGMIALATADITAARQAVTEGMPEMTRSWSARYTWPLLWLGMRIEADDATRHRDRREPVPAELTERCALLADIAAQVQTPAPSWEAYRELTAAESL